MSRVLFLANTLLEDPKRGTPLHICSMLREIRKEHDLLVCTHSVPPELSDVFIPYPNAYGFRKFLALRDIVRHNHITHVLTAGEIGLLAPVLLKLCCGVTIVDEIHGMGAEELYADRQVGWTKYVLLKWYVWTLLPFYDAVIVMLKRQAEYYTPISRHWRIAHVAVVVDEVPDVSRSITHQDTVVLGYMGNARSYQGVPYIVDAAATLKKEGMRVKLNLILSGDISEVEKSIEEHNLVGDTEIYRNVEHREAFRLIARSTVLLIPRPSSPVTEYAFPSKLPEYLATGLPVILTDVGPVDELRSDLEQYCEIVPPYDIAAHIAKAVQRLHNTDPETLRERGARARRWVGEHFSWEQRGKVINQCLRN